MYSGISRFAVVVANAIHSFKLTSRLPSSAYLTNGAFMILIWQLGKTPEKDN